MVRCMLTGSGKTLEIEIEGYSGKHKKPDGGK
jgi:hypothetical protein